MTRKEEVVRRWNAGESYRQIATAMGVSYGTVSGYITRQREVDAGTRSGIPNKRKIMAMEPERITGDEIAARRDQVRADRAEHVRACLAREARP